MEENVFEYAGLLEGFNVLLKSGHITSTMVFISETSVQLTSLVSSDHT